MASFPVVSSSQGRAFGRLSRPGLPLSEGREALAVGCAYCTNPRPPWSTPDIRAMAPDARAVRAWVLLRSENPRDRTPATWGVSTVGQGAAIEGLRSVGVHRADINPAPALHARAKPEHSNDPRWAH